MDMKTAMAEGQVMEGANAATEGDAEGAGGYCIEIRVDGSGGISVGVESGEYESAESAAMEQQGMPGPERQPASSIKEALTIALGIFKNNGQMQSASGEKEMLAAGFRGD